MEVAMMMTMKIQSPEASPPAELMSTTSWPSWKLYSNPVYNSQPQTHHLHHPHCRRIPQLRLSMADSEPDLESELIALKAEIEFQRKARKRAESVSRRLAKELAEERRARAVVEGALGELARRMASEIDRMKEEMEEERKMLRMVQVIREERVQMKLADAKILFEHKLSKLKQIQMNQIEQEKTDPAPDSDCRTTSDAILPVKFRFGRPEDETDIEIVNPKASVPSSTTIGKRPSPEEEERNAGSTSDSNSGQALQLNSKTAIAKLKVTKTKDESDMGIDLTALPRSASLSMAVQRGVSPEKENPHIKRGIKGFVEFPRVVRATASRSRHCHWGSKLDCQTAQLKILLKQKPANIRSTSLFWS